MKIFGMHIPSFRWQSPKEIERQVLQLYSAISAGDAPKVQDLLARGTPTAHPKLGADALTRAYEAGNVDVMAALLQAGATTPHLASLMFRATYDGNDEMALRMMELGVSPLYDGGVLTNRPLQVALDVTADRRSRQQLFTAFMSRLSQEEKDQLLAKYVSEGGTSCVRSLLDAGADPHQRSDGRTLLELAPEDAEEVRRMLRAIETGALLQSAMCGDGDQPPAPATSSLIL